MAKANKTVTRKTKPDWLGWHFLPADGCLAHGGTEKVIVGKTYAVTGPLVLCERGLHASHQPLDALQYATSAIICRVRLHGQIVEGDDKACATRRTVIAMADATRTLHEFSCWCARQALESERKAGHEPDARSWAAVQAKVDWLDGKITDVQLAAAWAAAGAAARAAARDAAWAAARAAAGAAAGAAGAAARAAAGAAAGDAAGDAQNTKLEEMLLAFLKCKP
jgi:hypothetical protein